MGIKDLNAFLKENAPSGIETVHLHTLSGKKVAIDTSIYLYKFLYKSPAFLEQFLEQIYKLMNYNITPIYIFDGIPSDAKNDTIKFRKNRRTDYKQRIAELQKAIEIKENSIVEPNIDESSTPEFIIDESSADKPNIVEPSIPEKSVEMLKFDLYKLKKKLIYVTTEHINQLKYFFELLNVKYIQAECEADTICSKLCEYGVVDMVLSDDMDLLVSGTTILLREFSIKSNNIIKYNLNTILDVLGITKEQWIDFCILCGCDYLKRIPGMGPRKSFKFIKECGNIEGVLAKYTGGDKRYSLPENYNFIRARELFNETKYYLPEYNNIDITIANEFVNQKKNIKNYLLKYTNLTLRKINNRIHIIYG